MLLVWCNQVLNLNGSGYSGSCLKGADLDPDWLQLQAFSQAFEFFVIPAEIALSS
jgi:hypothetical protein